jgi:hypothetical protein
LINGELLQITRIEDGVIYGRRLGPECRPAGAEKPITIRNFAHGYASTSHRSQGSTVDVTLAGLDRESVAGIDNKSFYVMSTRERKDIRYYVESKSALFEHAGRISGHRKSALELAHASRRASSIKEALKYKRTILDPIRRIGVKLTRDFIQLVHAVRQNVRKRGIPASSIGLKIRPEVIPGPRHSQSRSRGYSP